MSVDTMIAVENVINSYGYIVVLVLGSMGNLLVFILFIRQRPNASVVYIINSATANLLYLLTYYALKVLLDANNDESIVSLLVCKLSSYIPNVLGPVARTILTLACIDRYMITSRRFALRALSTPKRSKYLVFFTYIFWMIGASHCLPAFIVYNGQCGPLIGYTRIYTLYALLTVGLIPLTVVGIFVCLVCRNMRTLHRRIQPINEGNGHRNHILQRRDRDLLVLIIAEVIVYIITSALFPILLLELTISGYVMPIKSAYHRRTEFFIRNVSFFLLYIYSAGPFYIYITSSAAFRQDFRKLVVMSYRRLRRQPLDHPTIRLNQTRMRRETRV